MARKKKVATLKKRLKSKPFAYVDKKGNVRHFARGKKSSILQKKVIGKDLLKKRRAKGKKGILLYVKGKSVMSVARKAGGKRRKRKKAKRRSVRRAKKRKGRKRGRKRVSARKRKSRRCPKTRRGGGFRSATACVRAGKGKTIARKKVYNKAVRRLRKSKKGRAWLRAKKVKLAKVKGKAVKRKKRRKSRRKSRARRKSRRRR